MHPQKCILLTAIIIYHINIYTFINSICGVPLNTGLLTTGKLLNYEVTFLVFTKTIKKIFYNLCIISKYYIIKIKINNIYVL